MLPSTSSASLAADSLCWSPSAAGHTILAGQVPDVNQTIIMMNQTLTEMNQTLTEMNQVISTWLPYAACIIVMIFFATMFIAARYMYKIASMFRDM